MEVQNTTFDGVLLIKSRVYSDSRGFFCETFKAISLPEPRFIQDNLAFSKVAGTVRGLHFQRGAFAQSKLVAVLSGKILDVVVDLRKGSPTFGYHGWFPLHAVGSYPESQMLLVPKGFAHGYQTLEDACLVSYKVDTAYSPEHEAGIRWDDPDLAIDWPIKEATLSHKDQVLPLFKEISYE
jgi:dTDP-4-dehydrorhamnose 3,5-epimerase